MSSATSAQAKPDAKSDAKPDAKPKSPALMLVLDTTAAPGAPRIHEQTVDGLNRQFTFEANKGLPLEPAIAAKFLRHDAFKLVDEANNVIPYARPPRQPEDLQAGEKLSLGKDETVARYDELTNAALLKRALPLPGGERFADNPERGAVIAFILDTKAKMAESNKAKTPDVGKDDFIPAAETE